MKFTVQIDFGKDAQGRRWEPDDPAAEVRALVDYALSRAFPQGGSPRGEFVSAGLTTADGKAVGLFSYLPDDDRPGQGRTPPR